MPQGVQHDALEFVTLREALPCAAQAAIGHTALAAREDRVAFIVARQLGQYLDRRLPERSHAVALLCGSKPELASLDVDFRPRQRHYLAPPAAGQRQQPHGPNGEDVL